MDDSISHFLRSVVSFHPFGENVGEMKYNMAAATCAKGEFKV